MKKSLSIFIVLAIVIAGSLTLSAQAKPLGDVPTATPDPSHLSRGEGAQGSASASSGMTGVSPQSICTNLIADPSFEAGFDNPYWDEYSYNFGTPICDAFCGGVGPRTGDYWAWFGGSSAVTETAQVFQTVTIPIATTSTSLQFYLWMGTNVGAAADDVFYAEIDATPVFAATALDASSYNGYTLVTVDVSAFADGGAHDVLFEAFTSDQVVNFHVDDVSLCSEGFAIFLPVVTRHSCPLYIYDESLDYNMTIINAPLAWQCTRGKNITVAVIDTGVDLDHPELQANMVAGWNFVAGNSNPDDDQGHGSHVAGIAAGVGNNGGIIGVAPEAKIMPIKVLNSSGSGTMDNVALGIIWAADHGAKVLNLSLGSVSNSATVANAVNYANALGVLVIAAAGNCGDPSNYFYNGCSVLDQPSYPGALANVLAVASTTSGDQQSSFSTQGSYVDIAAPGSSIYSSEAFGGYAYHSGTSQAAPHVAGLAALIWTQNPSWTNLQVWNRIIGTALDLGVAGRDDLFGYGRISASTALGTASVTSLAEGASSSTEDVSTSPISPAAFVPGEILISLEANHTLGDVLRQAALPEGLEAQIQSLTTLSAIGVQKLSVPLGQEENLVNELQAAEGVAYVELNYYVTLH